MLRRVSFPLLCSVCLLLLGSPGTSEAKPKFFGYSGILCGLDDPHDSSAKTDYVDEVVEFTNINHVCFSGDLVTDVGRLKKAAKHFTPLVDVTTVYFEHYDGRLRPSRNQASYVPYLTDVIAQSGVSADSIVFYLADEPRLQGLRSSELEQAASDLKSRFPDTPIMVIEAYHAEGPPPIPKDIDLWGFDAYTVPDPATEPRYGAYLDVAAKRMQPHQQFVIVMDANFTPYHRDAGLTQEGMADVARAYLRFADSRSNVAMMLAYTWAGGIDHTREIGARSMGQAVINAHRQIGKTIIGRANK